MAKRGERLETVTTFFEMFNPSFLLFPAVVGSAVLGLVCPLVGAFLILRRTVFLGLALPQVAAAGIAFTFWLQQAGIIPALGNGDGSMGIFGSLLFTLLGIGLLGYLDLRGKGLAETRLAATYALAGALTILFIVFNPAGEVEILSLLKGEVVAMSTAELRILVAVFLMVFVGMVLFRREFLLSSFDRDLAFLLKGGARHWDVLLYLLAGLTIAIGVIMAGPLLVFGFLVLPPLAARPLIRGMGSFLILSSVLGVVMAIFGFYLSYSLDLPLGPTDVALGCGFVVLAYGVAKFLPNVGFKACWIFLALSLVSGCTQKSAPGFPEPRTFKDAQIWLGKVKNTTGRSLVLPGTNPLQSLRQMAGKGTPGARQTVMDIMREGFRTELTRQGVSVFYPEGADPSLARFPGTAEQAAEVARRAKVDGYLLLTHVERWSAESRAFINVIVDLKLVRISDGEIVWQRRYRRAVPTPSATHLEEAYRDAMKVVSREVFRPS
ncbi:MAG: hypothetical protein GTO40_25725 [Deltaproteobacteria bacterium]|nr:hypothetical protein [Deltaproteobacteria bacterium]